MVPNQEIGWSPFEEIDWIPIEEIKWPPMKEIGWSSMEEILHRIWAEKIEDRRGTNKAIVALAHRLSRIAFAILRDKSKYTKTIKRDYVKKEAA